MVDITAMNEVYFHILFYGKSRHVQNYNITVFIVDVRAMNKLQFHIFHDRRNSHEQITSSHFLW